MKEQAAAAAALLAQGRPGIREGARLAEWLPSLSLDGWHNADGSQVERAVRIERGTIGRLDVVADEAYLTESIADPSAKVVLGISAGHHAAVRPDRSSDQRHRGLPGHAQVGRRGLHAKIPSNGAGPGPGVATGGLVGGGRRTDGHPGADGPEPTGIVLLHRTRLGVRRASSASSASSPEAALLTTGCAGQRANRHPSTGRIPLVGRSTSAFHWITR